MSNNLVSIITPSYNSERFINECVKSVLAQTYINWEMVIIDDCSKDNSTAIITALAANDDRIRVFFLDKNRIKAVNKNPGPHHKNRIVEITSFV